MTPMTPKKRLPDFIIVGAMRAGTTALAGMLRRHPDVFVAKGEVHWFDKKQTTDLTAYAKRFASNAKIAGEKFDDRLDGRPMCPSPNVHTGRCPGGDGFKPGSGR